jgi:hypothetical protein
VTQLAVASCRGAPRDLGLDQGRALADEIRADLRAAGLATRSAWLDAFRAPAGADASFARDLARHFPHLDERVTGLADGVGCAREAIAALTSQELRRGFVGAARFDAAARRLELVLRDVLPPTGLVVRRVAPDGGYANVGATRPGLVFALAGVNEHGLAGVAQLDAATSPGDRCRVPGLLLLDQCIERLDTVEKALEWCERRPGGGRVRLVFADASGAAGAIEIDGEQRKRVSAPQDPIDAAGVSLRIDLATRALDVAGGGVATPAHVSIAADGADSPAAAP